MGGKQVPNQRSRSSACLRCRSLDQVVSVSAAVRAGRSTDVVRGSVTGRFGYDVPVTGHMVHVSALARALAAPRRPRAATGPAIVFGVSASLALWNLQLAVLEPADGTAWLGLLFFATVAAGSGWALRARQRHLRVVGPLIDEAMGLWQRSWFCRRCGVVSVYGPGAPAIVAVGGFASELTRVARQRRQQDGHVVPSRAEIRP